MCEDWRLKRMQRTRMHGFTCPIYWCGMRCCPEHVRLWTMLEVGTPKIECSFEEVGKYIWWKSVVENERFRVGRWVCPWIGTQCGRRGKEGVTVSKWKSLSEELLSGTVIICHTLPPLSFIAMPIFGPLIYCSFSITDTPQPPSILLWLWHLITNYNIHFSISLSLHSPSLPFSHHIYIYMIR